MNVKSVIHIFICMMIWSSFGIEVNIVMNGTIIILLLNGDLDMFLEYGWDI